MLSMPCECFTVRLFGQTFVKKTIYMKTFFFRTTMFDDDDDDDNEYNDIPTPELISSLNQSIQFGISHCYNNRR